MNTYNLGYAPDPNLELVDFTVYEFPTDDEARLVFESLPTGLIQHQVTLPNGEQTRPLTNGQAWVAHQVNRVIIAVFWGIRTP